MPSPIANVRSFNRTITRRLGVPDGSFLGRGLAPLSEVALFDQERYAHLAFEGRLVR